MKKEITHLIPENFLPPRKWKRFPFRLGMDPEFILLNEKLHYDSEATYVPHSHPDCGAYELNPNPSNNILKIIDNLHSIFSNISEQNPKKILTPNSLHSQTRRPPLGGHIHLEKIKNSIKINEAKKRIIPFLIPLMYTLKPLNHAHRRDTPYGKIYDTRTQDKTLEIRALDSTWLETPKKTYATLAYLGTVWYEIHKRKKVLNFSSQFCQQLTNLFLIEEKNKLYPTTKKIITKLIKKEIKNFTFYPYYKEAIDYILSEEPAKEEISEILYENWKIPYEKINCEEENLFYNDDQEVNRVVDLIKQMAKKENIVLQNAYFLYGFASQRKQKNIVFIKKDGTKFTAITKKTNYAVKKIGKTFCNRLNVKQNIHINKLVQELSKTQNKKQLKNPSLISIGIPFELRTDLPKLQKTAGKIYKIIKKIENNE